MSLSETKVLGDRDKGGIARLAAEDWEALALSARQRAMSERQKGGDPVLAVGFSVEAAVLFELAARKWRDYAKTCADHHDAKAAESREHEDARGVKTCADELMEFLLAPEVSEGIPDTLRRVRALVFETASREYSMANLVNTLVDDPLTGDPRFWGGERFYWLCNRR